MKRNAIVRIVLWSIVLLVLLSIMFALIYVPGAARRFHNDASAESPITDEFLEKKTFPPESIRNIDIEWVAGDILIQPIDTDQILVKEDGLTDPKRTMIVSVRQETLKIEFCEESIMSIGFHENDVSKNLTVYVPKNWVCNVLEVEAAFAALEVSDLTVRNVEFDGASGTCVFENCIVDKMDIDTASGDIRFTGDLNILDCDGASASVSAVLSNTPDQLDLDSMSGDLDITLPAEAGFSLSMDSLSGDFSTDFETTLKNGNYVAGDGSCRINVDVMSGDIRIRKGN